jgi:AAA family ATP:ADP antiporter
MLLGYSVASLKYMRITNSRETFSIFFAASTALMMVGHLQGGKTIRDALFLSYFDAIHLPKMMITTGVFSAIAVVIFSRILSRFGPASFTPPLYILSGVISIGEWMAMAVWPHIVTVVLYLHVTVIDSLLISGFFSIINERYDPYSAKKVISRMVVFTALGGLLGAGAASAVARMVDTRAVIAMLAILHLLSGLALYQVVGGQVGSHGQSGPPQGLVTILRRNTLIQRMALLMLTLAAAIALLDYLFKATLQITLSKEDLVTFFAYFYIAVDIGSLLLQTFVGTKALRWFGLGGTMIVMPLSVIFGGLITFVFRSLMSITMLRGGASLLTNSFFGPGFELIFTPISPADKRASKILIDVGAYRSGNMLGSLLIAGLLLLPGPTGSYILFTVMVLACAISLLIFLLNRGYISQLANNLRNGTLRLNEIEIKDTTTERTIALTQTSIERDRLLQQISDRRSGEITPVLRPPDIPKDISKAESLVGSAASDPEINAIQDLRSGDENRIRRVLVNRAITPSLLPHIIPLFRTRNVLQEALNAVRPLISVASGQLVDALLDHHQHPLIRRRIPLLLGQADNEVAVQGLTLGLQDGELDVRFRCAEALGHIKTNHAHLTIDIPAVWRVVYREIADLSASGYKSTQGVDPLRHLFNLLGVIFGPNVMDICFDSLQSEDLTIRGTALEYLENQLPQDVRTPLWPLIASGHSETRSERPAQEILRDLMKVGRAGKDEKKNQRKAQEDQ